MGVPALIGTCSQASGGGGVSSIFGIDKLTTATVSYGATIAVAQDVPKGQIIFSEMNVANNFTIPNDGVAFVYDFFAPVRVNHNLLVTFSNIAIVENELPPDGDCQITLEFQAQEATSGFEVIDMISGEPINDPPNTLVTIVYPNLDRRSIMGEGGFPFQTDFNFSLPNSGGVIPLLRFAQFDITNIDINMKILMGNGTEISAQSPPTLATTELSCKATLV